MCGIAGWVSAHPVPGDDLTMWGRDMGGMLAHRGPDDAGVWADGAAGVVLAHRRLSILDLSPAGRGSRVCVACTARGWSACAFVPLGPELRGAVRPVSRLGTIGGRIESVLSQQTKEAYGDLRLAS